MIKSLQKTLLLSLSVLFVSLQVFSQGFAGINAGNYAGITGVMLQPASIVDSRFKFDLNLFSTDIRYSNNYFLLNRNALLKFNKNNFNDYQTFRSRYLSEAQLPAGEKTFFNISNRTQLPLSFMLTLDDKSAIALNFQSRTMIQGRNISQDLAKLAFNSFYHQPLTDRVVDASGLSLRSLSWVEAGLTYGRVLFSSGNHFLKGAFTAKYLGGVSSLNLVNNNVTLRVNNDSTFNFNADRVTYNRNSNADLNKVIDSRLRPDANTFGFDAGLVYEYRGHLNNIRYIRNDDEESHEVKRRDLNKYIFRLGVSVLDAGMFRFNSSGNINSFRANIQNWDIQNSRYSSLRDFDTALANRVTPLGSDPREYNVYLPGALSVQLDIRFVKGLYLNALAYRPLKMGSESGTRFNNYGYYTITPRYERRHFGLYIPYTFSSTNDVTDYRENWLGLTMKLGPLFFGSSNLGTMAFNQTLKAADFFVGLKLGLTYGKPSNITRMLSIKKEDDYDSRLAEKEHSERTGTITGNNSPAIRDTAADRMVVDYTKGQVYTDGKAGQVIIINNYYYGNAGTNGKDSIYIDRNVSYEALQNANRVDSMAALARKQKADSTNRVLNDSLLQKREQLDTLIDRLNQLRQRLDSTGRNDQSFRDNNKPDNFAGSMQDSAKTRDIKQNNTGRNDAAELANERTGQNEQAKKKVTVQNTVPRQRNRTSNDGMLRQQDYRDESFEAYRRQTERLQADIERLQRQMAYNRSVVYTAASQPNYNQRNAPAPPTAVFYPAGGPTVSQPVREPVIIRDTVRIRDTVFIAKTDTVTKNIANTVFVAVPKETTVTEKIDYKKMPAENILFATGKATIGKVYEEKLSYFANILRNNPDLMMAISGHTDKTGSRAANELLSLKRANAVKSFFVNRGIAESRMQLTAVAAEDPLVRSNTKNAKAQNRRVEIKLLD